MTEPAVAVRSLTKVFPIPFRRTGLVAVRELDLEVAEGQVYGLLGPNGSGKSTTLKVILGLVAPTSGQTKIFGRDSREVRSREGVGFLPESPYFYRHLTGKETLHFYGKLSGLRGEGLNRQVENLLDLVGLQSARDRRLGGYSKGMLQRIGLAQALIREPKLVVLDEPTAGVDPEGSHEIRNLILDLKRRGITVLLSSHLLAQVQQICDRVGILARGVLVREGRVDDLLTIENQTELILENASPEIVAEISALLARSSTRLVEQRQPQNTLEGVFLEATRSQPRK
ncbi:MAG TPA: ABC transporter ATP-binding protein [Chthoniobacterales bacterium]